MVPHARLAEIPTFVFVLNSIREQIARHVKKSIEFFLKETNALLKILDCNACSPSPCLNGATCQVTG